MTSLTTTNADPILKQIYVENKVYDTTYRARPAFASIAKFEGFGGRNLPIPLKYGNPQGRSADFSLAQANRTPTRYEDFVLTRVNDYSVATIDADAAEATKSDNMAFLSALTAHIDSAMASLSDAIETFIFRNGEGWIGQISSGSNVATNTVTLADINDVTNFEVGMSLNAIDSADPDGATRNTDAEEVLAAVNRSTGTLRSTSAAWNTVITAIAAGDLLAVAGDAADGGDDVKLAGFEGWIPLTAPTSGDSWFGVDRSVDSRLMGQRYDGTALSVEEALIDGQSVGAREGGVINRCMINHVQTRTLKKELGSRIEYNKVPSRGAKSDFASISFRSLVLEGDHGPIDVLSCNKCPSIVAWELDWSTWKFYTLGPAVKFLMLDGLRILRQSSADGYEVRIGMRGNIGCNAPGYNTRVALTTPS
jgi:hypothetical protein